MQYEIFITNVMRVTSLGHVVRVIKNRAIKILFNSSEEGIRSRPNHTEENVEVDCAKNRLIIPGATYKI